MSHIFPNKYSSSTRQLNVKTCRPSSLYRMLYIMDIDLVRLENFGTYFTNMK